MYQIAIANEQKLMRLDKRRLTAIAETTLTLEQVRSAEISIAIVDDRRIHDINRQFLEHDEPTDVISFLLEDGSGRRLPAGRRSTKSPRRPDRSRATPRHRGAGKTLEGEIVISAEWAARVAAQVGTAPRAEVALYLVHGLLHLCGYDDLNPRERELMRRRESEVLDRCRIRYAAIGD